MRRIQKSALVPYSQEEMFDVVNDVASYNRFVPGCSKSLVIEQTASTMLASLELSKGPLSRAFTTRNRLLRPESIDIELAEGPLKHLSGQWQFQDLQGAGTKVSVDLRLGVGNKGLERVAGVLIGRVADSLVDVFVRRADDLYGKD